MEQSQIEALEWQLSNGIEERLCCCLNCNAAKGTKRYKGDHGRKDQASWDCSADVQNERVVLCQTEGGHR
jgi:hypothetical protein